MTASDEYAIKAFKFAAIDYVLKPYSIDDLAQSIEKAKQQINPNKERLDILKDTLEQPKNIPQKSHQFHVQNPIIAAVDQYFHLFYNQLF